MASGTARLWSLERYTCGEESLLPTATGCGFEGVMRVRYIIYRVRGGTHVGGDSVMLNGHSDAMVCQSFDAWYTSWMVARIGLL